MAHGNTLDERVLRSNAVLRKNRSFSVGADCGQHIGTPRSLVVSCRQLASNPLKYLTWSLSALRAPWTPLAHQKWLEPRSIQAA